MFQGPKTKERPFGYDLGVIGNHVCVVCRNDIQREKVIESFMLRAHYILVSSAVCGARYEHIIVMPDALADLDPKLHDEWFGHIATHLNINGKMTYL